MVCSPVPKVGLSCSDGVEFAFLYFFYTYIESSLDKFHKGFSLLVLGFLEWHAVHVCLCARMHTYHTPGCKSRANCE